MSAGTVDDMAMPLLMNEENALRPPLAGSSGSAPAPVPSTAAADASPRWSDPDPRPGSGHWVPTAWVGAARPVLTFPTGGHRCGLYRVVCGFYECLHGHVRRISVRARGGTA
ncbi:hypothetical protein GTS_35650 [Gandjariella thermophila]|uniref:Uncharacterized protein n=1 Tax=Gandjariella thermophila TaxID=1931992 RepID=A0A4D4J9J3_9PSEU|nr:hypothetical protein GTS_35650 [Gandjariella thermophila]